MEQFRRGAGDVLKEAKEMGFSDLQPSHIYRMDELKVREHRKKQGLTRCLQTGGYPCGPVCSHEAVLLTHLWYPG